MAKRGPGANEALRALAPAQNAVAVTPNDGADLSPAPTIGLWVGGAGTISVILAGDTNPVTFSGVPAGTFLPLMVQRVRATGTTATLIIALY